MYKREMVTSDSDGEHAFNVASKALRRNKKILYGSKPFYINLSLGPFYHSTHDVS